MFFFNKNNCNQDSPDNAAHGFLLLKHSDHVPADNIKSI